jgi:UDP-N-acetylmuramoyl-tripeptide--D-alanyl-D-alanine ligase
MERIKAMVVTILNRAVSRYIRRNHIKVIAVAGSIGKTSTTNAIRTVLSQKYRVHQPKTAYNTNKSVHLEMFDLSFATNPLGWFWTVGKVLLRTLGRAPYEVLVIEIGTDHPGELRTFDWLQPDIGVLTAIAPEHMEYFRTIEAVAEEELLITGFCKQLVFNSNAVARKYLPADLANAGAERLVWYGKATDFEARNYRVSGTDVRADFRFDGNLAKGVNLQVLGVHSLDALMAATAVAAQCGLTLGETASGLRAVQPVRGRMQRLDGLNGSIIIDDSYNASPAAVKAALDVLVQFDVPQRIAVLGSMNEMGDYSERAHREAGAYCDPDRLDVVVTIGADANQYLAAEAEKRGCTVERFLSPYNAGDYIKGRLNAGAAVLFKGSQNGVFAEEAIKSILADQADAAKLVRQSDYWMNVKRQQFKAAQE